MAKIINAQDMNLFEGCGMHSLYTLDNGITVEHYDWFDGGLGNRTELYAYKGEELLYAHVDGGLVEEWEVEHNMPEEWVGIFMRLAMGGKTREEWQEAALNVELP